MIAFIWSKPMITNYKEQFVQKKRTFFAYGKSMSVQKSTGTYILSTILCRPSIRNYLEILLETLLETLLEIHHSRFLDNPSLTDHTVHMYFPHLKKLYVILKSLLNDQSNTYTAPCRFLVPGNTQKILTEIWHHTDKNNLDVSC